MVQLDRPSAFSTFVAKYKARSKAKIHKRSNLGKFVARKLRRKRKVWLGMPKVTEPIVFVPAAVALLIFGLVIGVSRMGSDDEPLAAPQRSTTTAVPTTTGPPDPVEICEARTNVVEAAAVIAPEDHDLEEITTGLSNMSAGLAVLDGADRHPDLVASVRALTPVVGHALDLVETAQPDDLAAMAEDPMFLAPETADAIATILSYQLNCAAGG